MKNRRKSKKLNISTFNTIQVVLDLSKEDMERALKSESMRINGSLYEIPVIQLTNYISNKQYNQQKFILEKIKK